MRAWRWTLIALLAVASSEPSLGQHHGNRGANPAPPPTGPAQNDDLKDFSRAIALQASAKQTEVFFQAAASIELAKKRLSEFQRPEGTVGSDYSRAKALADAADEVELDSNRFLFSFSDAQKSGLKAPARRARKAVSEIDKDGQVLNNGPSLPAAERLAKSLQDLQENQSAMAKEMGITIPESH